MRNCVGAMESADIVQVRMPANNPFSRCPRIPVTSALFVVVCGLPGAGKTTHAMELARKRDAIRLSADDWMERLEVNVWNSDVRERVEQLQWDLAQDLLLRSNGVIIEWGTWSQAERDALRTRAQELGARVELHYVYAPFGDLFDRLQTRNAEDPPITEQQLREWSETFEPPDEDEGSAWDRFLTIGPRT